MQQSRLLADDEASYRTNSLAGLATVLLLIVLALVVVRKLQVRSMMEACVMSQQLGCEVAVEHLRVSKLMDRFWAR